jgi:hypothetical protein
MVQAARSGKQNIVEGSEVSGTPKETEIKLKYAHRGSWKYSHLRNAPNQLPARPIASENGESILEGTAFAPGKGEQPLG